MKKLIKIQCPAKINLDLKVVNKRPDGFHNIESVMQTVSLYDYLTITVKKSDKTEIILSGNSTEIPYNEKNIVYKAVELFLKTCVKEPQHVDIYIDKNIPVSAGLAGGSTNGAGTFFGLNKIFGNILSDGKLHELCAQLGSDLNFCLKGGCMQTHGRGEVLSDSEYKKRTVNLIKPIKLGISAKEAYTKFSERIKNSVDIDSRANYVNDLEWALINDYPELQHIKAKYPTAIMTGSGSTYFSLDTSFEQEEGYWVKNGLETTEFGVAVVE